jgi:hypothetical protein
LTALTAQPTTKREYRSRIAARYSLARLSPTYGSVVSPTGGSLGRRGGLLLRADSRAC